MICAKQVQFYQQFVSCTENRQRFDLFLTHTPQNKRFNNGTTGLTVNSDSKCKGKGIVQPVTGREGPEVEQRYNFTLSLTSALDGDGRQRHAPVALSPGKTHCIGGWVGPRAGLDGCGKSRSFTRIQSPDRPVRSESL